MNLREQALEAYAKQQAEYTKHRAEDTARREELYASNFSQALATVLGIQRRVAPGQETVEIDGLTFACRSRNSLALVQPCEFCGQPIRSEDILSLVSLGTMLQDQTTFSPYNPIHRHGRCLPKSSPELQYDHPTFTNEEL